MDLLGLYTNIDFAAAVVVVESGEMRAWHFYTFSPAFPKL